MWAQERKFSPEFSLLSIFLPQPNSGKQYFSPYFPFSIFHPPYFHPKQTQLKCERTNDKTTLNHIYQITTIK